ncbi:hypothetical protein ABMA28_015898 [Loxostege sticticalis]|uniref:Elongation of very long chain fatty acids protein n=1 Tax=Loxostege sticticalis TaxID=481309 RepID=A0ABD0TBF9_LOXSC
MASVEDSDVNEYVFVRTFEEVNEYPFSDSLLLVLCLVGGYLLFVLKIGPAFMKNREPYKLKNTILAYNAFQVALSAYFIYLTGIPMVMAGLFPKRCCEEDPTVRKEMLRCVFIYWLGKITELADTVFFILRKKYNQVSFLHVYHHASVVLGTWVMFKYSVNQTAVYAGFINAVVHVIMYFYYFMAALGPQYQKYLTWKKHITSFQLIQFVTVIIHQIISLAVTRCKHSVLGIFYVIYSCVLFYVLFNNFYKKSYTQKKANGTKTSSAVDKTQAETQNEAKTQ